MVAFDGITLPQVHVWAGFSATPAGACVRGAGLRGTAVRGGVAMVELPAADVTSIGWQRGRSAPLASAEVGTATIVLDNRSGAYDPANLLGPYRTEAYQTVASWDAGTQGWTSEAGSGVATAWDTVTTHDGAGSLSAAKTVGGGSFQSLRVTDNTDVTHDEAPGVAYALWIHCPAESGWVGRVDVTDAAGGNIAGNETALTAGDWTYVKSNFDPVVLQSIQRKIVQVHHPAPAAGAKTFHLDSLVRWVNTSLVDLDAPVLIQAEFPPGTYHDRFTGKITDIAVDAGMDPTVTLTCADGLETLGRAALAGEVAQFGGDYTGDRIGHLADRAGWPAAARLIDQGSVQVAPTILGAAALELMRQTELSELGLLFVDGHGNLVFYDRHRTSTANRSVVVQAAFTDTAGGVEMLALTFAKSADQVINDVHITRAADPAQDPELTGVSPGDMPVEQIATDTASVARRGTLSLSTQVGQLLTADPDALGLAAGIVGLYSVPRIRIRQVAVDATTLGLWSQLLPLGLLDRISVSRDYGPNTITGQLLIQAMTEEITDEPSWRLTFTTAEPPPAVGYCTRGGGIRGADPRGW